MTLDTPPSLRNLPGIGAPRLLAALSLGFALLGSALLLSLALDSEERIRPALFLLSLALFLSAPLLGLLSLILDRRARRRAALGPTAFAAPGWMHPGVGLLALGVWGLSLVLLLPVYARTPRGRARDRAAIWNLEEGLRELMQAYEKAQAKGFTEDQQLEALTSILATHAYDKNPWRPGRPGFQPRVLASGLGQTAAEELARREATERGQVVFVLSAPAGVTEPRWLAGAVRIREKEDPSVADGGKVIMKTSLLGTP